MASQGFALSPPNARFVVGNLWDRGPHSVLGFRHPPVPEADNA